MKEKDEFRDEQAYETIEELQQAAALSDSEPMRALFEDTAVLVFSLMKERDEAMKSSCRCLNSAAMPSSKA